MFFRTDDLLEYIVHIYCKERPVGVRHESLVNEHYYK